MVYHSNQRRANDIVDISNSLHKQKNYRCLSIWLDNKIITSTL